MKIALGCSMKNRSLAQDVFKKLENIGLNPLFPNLFHTEENLDKGDTPDKKKWFAEEHHKAISDADICYWIISDSHLGTSCKIELGYALAKNKPIYFSEPTNDQALDCYVKEFISTKELERFLEVL